MVRSNRAWLRDILEAIAEIRQFVAGAHPSLQALSLLQYNAVLYSLVKIAEAVRQLPDELKQSRPDMPWKDIARTGNLLRHATFASTEASLRT